MPLGGRPLVEWSIDALRAAPSIGSIVLACPPGHRLDFGGDRLEVGDGDVRIDVVDGGETRAQSVANALSRVETELVAIHDAARPLLTPDLVEGVIATLLADPGASGAIAAVAVTDTIKQVSDRVVLEVGATLDRDHLWAAQTPQVFRVAALREALAGNPETVAAATDESMLVEAAGGRVLIHPAPAENIKVTTAIDLRIAESLLSI